MKLILLFIVIAFCSCTSSGKLTDAEFPYKKAVATLGNTYATYNGTPLNAGSYTVRVSFLDTDYLGKKYKPKFSILKYLPYIAIGLSILLAIFLFMRNRDEIITMPDDLLNENQ